MPPRDDSEGERRVQELERQLKALSDERASLVAVLAAVPAVVLRVDLDGRIEYVNRVLPEYEARPPLGESVYSYVPADQHALMRHAIEATVAHDRVEEYEVVASAPDGTRDWYHTVVTPMHGAGRVVAVTLTCTNITRLRKIEEELRDSQERVALALDAGNVGVWSWDRASDAVTWDAKLCTMFGLELADAPTTVAGFLALVSEDQWPAMGAHIERALATGHYPDFELRVDTPEGNRWYVIKGGMIRDKTGAIVGLLGGVIDDTERRRLLDHVREAQKIDAVGQLGAGVAHNFNNMLAGIIPVLALAARSAAAPLDELLKESHQSAIRASELVRDLMFVSRGQAPTGAPEARSLEPLRVVLTRALELCQRTFTRAIAIETHIDDAVAEAVWVDPIQVEQALLNLLLNARDALDEVDPELARITVTATEPDAPDGARGMALQVQIRDTGHGMDEATRARVFEPFFTTKPVDSGTGLGLATAWATIKAHGGTLACSSTPGAGSVFTLVLPALPPGAGPTSRTLAPATSLPTGGAERQPHILLIDDDDAVRRAMDMALTSLGYRVSAAASGLEGVRAFAREHADVVILDHSMPGQGSDQTLAQLRDLVPRVPVLIYSGLDVRVEGATGYIAKPATMDVLHAELQRAMGA